MKTFKICKGYGDIKRFKTAGTDGKKMTKLAKDKKLIDYTLYFKFTFIFVLLF